MATSPFPENLHCPASNFPGAPVPPSFTHPTHVLNAGLVRKARPRISLPWAPAFASEVSCSVWASVLPQETGRQLIRSHKVVENLKPRNTKHITDPRKIRILRTLHHCVGPQVTLRRRRQTASCAKPRMALRIKFLTSFLLPL